VLSSFSLSRRAVAVAMVVLLVLLGFALPMYCVSTGLW
jgi:hypothetical protein